MTLRFHSTCRSLLRCLLATCGSDAFSIAAAGPGFVRVRFTWRANSLCDSLFILASVLPSRSNVWLSLAVGSDEVGQVCQCCCVGLLHVCFAFFWTVGGGGRWGLGRWVGLSSPGGCFLGSRDLSAGHSPICVFSC
jgi:hypothetical protein